MDKKTDNPGDRLMDMDTRYRNLSFQLFGFQGPFVNLSRKKSSAKLSRWSNNKEMKLSRSSDDEQCLICHSPIINQTANWEDFFEFLGILQEPLAKLYGNQSIFNLTVNQLKRRIVNWCICDNCNAACGRLIKIYRQMKKLEEEVKEYQVKFMNAIKLSKVIAEKDPDLGGKGSNEIVEQLRTCLIGGTEKWEGIKGKWMEYVNLEGKVTKPEVSLVEEPDVQSRASEIYSGGEDDDDDHLIGNHDDDNLIKSSCHSDVNMDMPLKTEMVEDLESEMDGWGDNSTFFVDYDDNNLDLSSGGGDGNGNHGNKTGRVLRQQKRKRRKMSSMNYWVKKGDDKILYCGVEIRKNGDGTFSCISCENGGSGLKPVKTKLKMSIHIKKEHLALGNQHACDKCDARFFYYCQLEKHVKGKHEGGLKCETCGESFQHASSLFTHKKVKHKGIRPHVCEHCGKGFGTMKDLTVHVRVHTGERPFVCHVCAKSFTQKQNMRQHIKKHHPEDSEDSLMEPVKQKDELILI